MKKKIINNKYIILFFAILFLLNVPNISKTFGNWDLNLEQNIVLSNIKQYSQMLKINEIVKYCDDIDVQYISINDDKDHGVALYYMALPIILIRESLPEISAYLWNFYTFIIFFIGVICFYKLMILLYKDKKIAIIMTLLYYLNPRIFIDAIHNSKDLSLMTLIIIDTYLVAKIIKEQNNKDMILFAIISAFLCNIKIIGIFFAFILGLTYVIYLIINKKINKQNLFDILFIIVLTIAIYIVITPAIWSGGKIELISFIKYCLKRDSKFGWTGSVLFEGKKYIVLTKNLPLYYLPKFILITMPIMINLLFIIGVIILIVGIIVKSIKKKKIILSDYIAVSSLINFLVPFILYFTLKPIIYNGWRHFYFLYSSIIIIASFALNSLLKIKKYYLKNIVLAVCIISLSYSLFSIVKYGVANTAYYNILVGNKDISSEYEMDPYAVTTKDAFWSFVKSEKISEYDRIYLYANEREYLHNSSILDTLLIRGFREKYKIVLVNDKNIDKYIKAKKKIYIFSNTSFINSDPSKYKLVYSYKIRNNRIINFYIYN